MSKPYVLFIFASQAKITEEIDMRGRVGLIPSSDAVRSLYDYNRVRDAGVNVVAVKDSNEDEDKHNIGVLQAFSELADNIAESKGVELTKTIPNDTQVMVWVLRFFIYAGSILVLWIYVIRPRYERMKNGRK